MLAAVQPPQGNGGNSDRARIATADHVPRTRVDSGHVVDRDGIIRRIPKLAVRNRTSDESNDNEQTVAASSDTASEHEHSAPVSSNSSQRVRTPMSNRSVSDESTPRRRQLKSQRQSADSSNLAPTTEPSPARKKKRGGMLNFLTLKEPSTAAWAEFAEAEKAKAKQRGVNVCGTGAHAVSSQKLPDYVPKVNSKWDGLPDSAHRKSMDSKAANKANSMSVMSTATRDTTSTATSTTSSDWRRMNKAYPVLSDRSADDSWQSNPPTSYGRPISSADSGSQPPALALEFDSEPVERTDDNLPQTFLRDASPPPQIRYMPDSTISIPPPELDGIDIQELGVRTPESATTPPADGSEARPALAGIHYPELDSQQKAAELFSNPRTDAVVRANSSRRAINFSRPQVNRTKPTALPTPDTRGAPTITTPPQETIRERSSSPLSQSDRSSVILSPTLKTPTGNIEPFLTDTFASHSRETGHIPQRVASTLQKPATRSGGGEEEDPVSPISPLEQQWQPASIPEVTMRPATATSMEEDAAVQKQDRRGIESQSQVSLVNSVAPSELSERWQMSPKERLGLGSRLRKSEVSPWEDDQDDGARGQLSPSLSVEGKGKRLSWFSGRKEK